MTKQELKFAFRHFLEERGMWESYVMAYNVDNGYWECGTYTGNVDAFLSRVEPLDWFYNAFIWSNTRVDYVVWGRLNKEWHRFVKSQCE